MPSLSIPKQCTKCGADLTAYTLLGSCPACALERATQNEDAGGGGPKDDESQNSEEQSALPPSFGDYELLEEIARGGMGVVYKARQLSLNRVVALKMVLTGRLAKTVELQRFQAEAEIAAQLQHPNIVAIYEVGENHDQPFFAMEYVEGRSLAELAHNEPLPTRRAAHYLKAIAEAVQYAHSRGVLHRDLKPSNILIDGADQPRITDFGLAKRLDDSPLSTLHSPLTLTGQVLGSPNFMPPEQAAGDRRTIGPTSDVYSLGAILYQLLTGRPPFLAETLAQTLRSVAESEPVSPRLVAPAIPLDLETICLKCLEKDPLRRYDSAQALAADLDHYLRDEPIHARPIGATDRLWRWCRRRPVVAGLTVAVGLLLLAVTSITSVSALRLARSNQSGREKLWEAYLAQARASRWSGRPGRRFDSLKALSKAAEIRPSIELRNEAINCLPLVDLSPARVLDFPEGTRFTSFDSDYQRYARSDQTGRLVVRQLADDHLLLALSNFPPLIEQQSLSPDGRFLVVGAGNDEKRKRELWVFDVASGQTLLHRSNGWVKAFGFALKGQHLVTVEERRGETLLSVDDITTRDKGWSCSLSQWPLATHHHRLLSSIPDGTFGLARSQTIESPLGHLTLWFPRTNAMINLNWSASEDALAIGSEGGKIQIWNFQQTPPRTISFGEGGSVIDVRFNPRGNLLASIAYDNQLRLWDVWSGKQLLSKPVLGYIPHHFSSDGRLLACTPSERRMELCEVADGRECVSLNFSGAATSCSYSPDNRLIVSSHPDGARLWEPASGRQLGFVPANDCQSAFFDASGRLLFTGCDAGLKCWGLLSAVTSTNQGSQLMFTRLLPESAYVGAVAVDSTAQRASAIIEGNLHVLEIPTGRILRKFEFERPGAIFQTALSPGGRFCAATSRWENQPLLWDIDKDRALPPLSAYRVSGLEFSPDGQLLITGGADDYTAWETKAWTRLWTFRRENSGGNWARIAFTFDGKMAAVAHSRQAVRLIEPASGRELATFEAPEAKPVTALNFSRDGGQLAVVAEDSVIQLWDLRLIRHELALLKLDWDSPPLPPPPTAAPFLKIEVVPPASPNSDPPH